MKSAFLAIVLCFAPAAATAQETGATVLSNADIQKFEALARDRHAAERTQLAGLSGQQVSDALKANLANKTKIIFQKGYGVFVEYSSADGQDRMWFPGNQDVVKGIWGVRDRGAVHAPASITSTAETPLPTSSKTPNAYRLNRPSVGKTCWTSEPATCSVFLATVFPTENRRLAFRPGHRPPGAS